MHLICHRQTCIIVPAGIETTRVRIINHRLTDPRAECVMSLPIPLLACGAPFWPPASSPRHVAASGLLAPAPVQAKGILHRLQQPYYYQYCQAYNSWYNQYSRLRFGYADPYYAYAAPYRYGLRWRSAWPRLQQVPHHSGFRAAAGSARRWCGHRRRWLREHHPAVIGASGSCLRKLATARVRSATA